ncbi:MAG TPA: 2OG-Fe(II) oxygenase [Caldimonas sp.]
MTDDICFAPALGAWVARHLARGERPNELVQAMLDLDIAEDAARRIVDAFVRCRDEGSPAPVDRIDGARVRVLARATRPVLAVLSGVLDDAECTELIERARGRLRPSTLVDPLTGRDVASGQRGSAGTFFRLREDAFIARLDERFAEIMRMPVANGEGLQVLHYPTGAGSAPHFDFLAPTNTANLASIGRSGQRVSTMVAYLNDVPAGGETEFPAVGWSVTPQRGHAVLFAYCNDSGELDHDSVHASRPVERGEKWVVTKWMRERPFVSA